MAIFNSFSYVYQRANEGHTNKTCNIPATSGATLSKAAAWNGEVSDPKNAETHRLFNYFNPSAMVQSSWDEELPGSMEINVRMKDD